MCHISDLERYRHSLIETEVSHHLVLVNWFMQSSVNWVTCVEVRETHATIGDETEVFMHDLLPLV
jgi:hypothetical protein